MGLWLRPFCLCFLLGIIVVRRISHSWKEVYFLFSDVSVTNVCLKLGCINSLKWQLSNCLHKPEASGAQASLKPWDLGEAGKRRTRRGVQGGPWFQETEKNILNCESRCVSRQRGSSAKASVRLGRIANSAHHVQPAFPALFLPSLPPHLILRSFSFPSASSLALPPLCFSSLFLLYLLYLSLAFPLPHPCHSSISSHIILGRVLD